MSCLQQFKDRLRPYGLPQSGETVLLAVSGGLDSVVLCRLSKEAGLSFALAHCNFGLRGEESQRDERFVRELAKTYGVAVYVKTFDTRKFAEEQRLSIQEAARNLRYSWFDSLRKEHAFRYTFLAHHANDNIETLLLNFFRGTGLEGLTGMPEERTDVRCLRPMLHLKRTEIAQYAKENHLQWVEDSSNASVKYTRNYFRNELIPGIQTVFPQVEENLLNNIRRMNETAALYNDLVAALKKKVCITKGEEVHIPVLKLQKYKNTSLIYEIIRDYDFGESFVEEVIKLTGAASGKYIANDHFRIIRHRAWLIIAPIAETAQTLVIEKEDEVTRLGTQELRLAFLPKDKFSLDASPHTAQLDAKEIEFPLVLRKWKKGDYFYPLGMRKKKKLARFYIDQKLSQIEKEKVWVLESHKRIVWVCGYRIDDRFKVTENTRQVLQLTISSLSPAGRL